MVLNKIRIVPKVVIVAFNHGFENTEILMVKQMNTEAPIIIEDNV